MVRLITWTVLSSRNGLAWTWADAVAHVATTTPAKSEKPRLEKRVPTPFRIGTLHHLNI
jgi:hypothetical protein